jgi:hypothetical protein
MNDNNQTGAGCSTSCSGFNYCFWAKIIVAIPAIPLIGVTIASHFSEPAWQFTMASYSGAVVVILAQYIDRLPSLSKKFGKQS